MHSEDLRIDPRIDSASIYRRSPRKKSNICIYIYKIPLFHTEYSSNLLTYLLTYHSRLTDIKNIINSFPAKHRIFRVSVFSLL